MQRNLHECFLMADKDPDALQQWYEKHRLGVEIPISSEG